MKQAPTLVPWMELWSPVPVGTFHLYHPVALEPSD